MRTARYDGVVEERVACAQLKSRFEAAGFRIAENVPFEDSGKYVDLDGYDAEHRVGYEYVTEEAGDSWDVDDDVIAMFDAFRRRGGPAVLVVKEEDAPDAASLDAKIDAFLATLPKSKPAATKPAPAKKKPAAKKKRKK